MNIYTEWKRVNLATPEQAEKIALKVRYGPSMNSLEMDELIRKIAASIACLTDGNVVHITEESSERSVCMDYGAVSIGRFVSAMTPAEFSTDPILEAGKIGARIIVVADYLYAEIADALREIDIDYVIIEPYGDYLANIIDMLPDDIRIRLEENPFDKIRNSTVANSYKILFWDEFLETGKDTEFTDEMLSRKADSDVCLMGRSGGTTGSPKGIMHTNERFIAKSRMLRVPGSIMDYGPGDTVLMDLGPRYITGRALLCLHPLNAGATVAINQFSDITDSAGALEWSRATVFVWSVTQCRAFEKSQALLPKPKVFPYVRRAACGGEWCSRTTFLELCYTAWQAGFGSFRVGFGASEFMPVTMEGIEGLSEAMIAAMENTSSLDEFMLAIPEYEKEFAGWYAPISEVEILLKNEAGDIIEGEGVGISWTHSPAIMLGYLDEKKNNEFFGEINGELWGCNDDIYIMKTDSDGRKWFKPLGRKNHLTYFIDEKDEAVYGVLVDDFLADNELTNKYIHRVQTVVPDDNSHSLAAHIELKAEYRDEEENTIKKIAAACAKNLGGNLMPSEFEVWQIMPHSSSRGKVDLEALSAKSKRKLNNIYTF